MSVYSAVAVDILKTREHSRSLSESESRCFAEKDLKYGGSRRLTGGRDAGEAQRAAYVIVLEAKWSASMRSRPSAALMERFSRARDLVCQSAPVSGTPNNCSVACRCAPPPLHYTRRGQCSTVRYPSIEILHIYSDYSSDA